MLDGNFVRETVCSVLSSAKSAGAADEGDNFFARANDAAIAAVTVNDLSPSLTIARGLSCARFEITYTEPITDAVDEQASVQNAVICTRVA